MDWQEGADGFDFQDKLARDNDIRLEAVADSAPLYRTGIVTCRAKAMPASANSRHRHSSDTDSNSPGPVWSPGLTRGCTSIANPITRSSTIPHEA